jgi:hypothetical protein
MNNNMRRDDNYGRLSFLLQNEYDLFVKNVSYIKPKVLLIHTNEGTKVLKGYHSLKQATLQVIYMKSLRQAGFYAVPSLKTDTLNSGIIYYHNMYWILQDYISSCVPFSFVSSQERKDGLALLERYHHYSKLLLKNPFLQAYLPLYSLYDKWWRRYQCFLYYLPFIRTKLSEDTIDFILQSANGSLQSLVQFYSYLKAEAHSIIHGDVASHNFLRAEDSTLYLIDYDLIAIAPKSIDYLQYANRILPSLEWSLAGLQELPQIRKQLHKRWFLSALMFPADILREWNAFITRHSFHPHFISNVIEYTNSQFEKRKQFVQQICDMLR